MAEADAVRHVDGKDDDGVMIGGRSFRGSSWDDPEHALRQPEVMEEADVAIDVRLIRLVVTVGVVMGVLMGAVMLFKDRLRIGEYVRYPDDAEERKRVLDNYNSWSGAIAAVVQKPLEVLTTMVMAVFVLTVGHRWMLVAKKTWTIRLTVMAVMSLFCFLLTTALTALNIQLVETTPLTFMTDNDLVARFADPVANVSTSQGGPSKNDIVVFSERRPRNPVTNTVLRNALLSYQVPAQTNCTNGVHEPLSVNVAYGMALRSWQSEMLPRALDLNDPRVSTNVTISVGANVPASQTFRLPMKASAASKLIALALPLASRLLPNASMLSLRLNNTSNSTSIKAVDVLKLRSTGADASNDVVRRSHQLINDMFEDYALTRSTLEFRHIQVNDQIVMDSFTLEMALPSTMTRSATGSDSAIENLFGLRHATNGVANQFDSFWSYQMCAEHVPVCYRNEANLKVENELEDQINAAMDCAGDDVVYDIQGPPSLSKVCEQTSNNSFLVYSASSRLVGDAMHLGVDPSGSGNRANTLTLVNPHRMYTLTVARVTWTVANLSEAYGAGCEAMTSCDGLRFQLMPSSALVKDVIVGAGHLPLGQLRPIHDHRQALQLVSLSRFYKQQWEEQDYHTLLLGHNFQHVNWTLGYELNTGINCSMNHDRSARRTVGNHLYMEGTLQPVYTSAMFFLFQNAVVRETLKSTRAGKQLGFSKVVQPYAVIVSIPERNAFATIGGSVLLCLASLVVAYMSRHCNKLSVQIGANTAARVMIDESTFPSLLLRKSVVLRDSREDMGNVTIQAIALATDADASCVERDMKASQQHTHATAHSVSI